MSVLVNKSDFFLYCCCLFLQVELFQNIKPLFSNKPLIVVVNKIDVKRLEELEDEKKVCINSVNSLHNQCLHI